MDRESSPPTARPAAELSALARLFLREDLNFLLTNRIPRRYATLLMGWYSRIESPLLTRLSLAVWQRFAGDLRLDEAKRREFTSLRDCFIRELRPGARPIDPDPTVVVSPCDAVVGACGRIDGTDLFQAKGFPYTLMDLLRDRELVEKHRDGTFVTLRLKSSMYHRFHAPCDGRIRRVVYVSGDTWNVNPIALRRVERLFCRNERVVLDLELDQPGRAITMIPVAAILVASVRLHFLAHPLDLRYRGDNRIACDAAFVRGQELGYFENGSTILVFATGGYRLADAVVEGATLRVGEPLFTTSPAASPRPPGEPA
ncbi:archaetidylserine decarboxylase [Nannocystis punicea]|uniref:phosphatidylserine decarboxylase n=1 Tax=Nannocystis punicea TaxID=2995304 RepID=A0ABY7GW46_9BACT|nr:archaetidylserine decarboxylase [Nannocystis poenicansa]WAS91211.1 archaetidylserine decarboxylase [Nannocystis poenicansa]